MSPTRKPDQRWVDLQLAVAAGFMAIGLYTMFIHGLVAYVVFPPNTPVRASSITVLAVMWMLFVKNFRWKGIFMALPLAASAEIMWDVLYTVRCPSSLPLAQASSPYWLQIIALEAMAGILGLIIAKPTFVRTKWLGVWILWLMAWFAVGMPVPHNYCPTGFHTDNDWFIVFDAINALLYYTTFFKSLRPRPAK